MGAPITSSDLDKINSVLKQFVRDWSGVGAQERTESYAPVLKEIKQLYWSSERFAFYIYISMVKVKIFESSPSGCF